MNLAILTCRSADSAVLFIPVCHNLVCICKGATGINYLVLINGVFNPQVAVTVCLMYELSIDFDSLGNNDIIYVIQFLSLRWSQAENQVVTGKQELALAVRCGISTLICIYNRVKNILRTLEVVNRQRATVTLLELVNEFAHDNAGLCRIVAVERNACSHLGSLSALVHHKNFDISYSQILVVTILKKNTYYVRLTDVLGILSLYLRHTGLINLSDGSLVFASCCLVAYEWIDILQTGGSELCLSESLVANFCSCGCGRNAIVCLYVLRQIKLSVVGNLKCVSAIHDGSKSRSANVVGPVVTAQVVGRISLIVCQTEIAIVAGDNEGIVRRDWLLSILLHSLQSQCAHPCIAARTIRLSDCIIEVLGIGYL